MRNLFSDQLFHNTFILHKKIQIKKKMRLKKIIMVCSFLTFATSFLPENFRSEHFQPTVAPKNLTICFFPGFKRRTRVNVFCILQGEIEQNSLRRRSCAFSKHVSMSMEQNMAHLLSVRNVTFQMSIMILASFFSVVDWRMTRINNKNGNLNEEDESFDSLLALTLNSYRKRSLFIIVIDAKSKRILKICSVLF